MDEHEQHELFFSNLVEHDTLIKHSGRAWDFSQVYSYGDHPNKMIQPPPMCYCILIWMVNPCSTY